MKYHPDYPTINQVQSFLISNKPPSKLLAESKSLVQSKHTVDSITTSYKMPSDQCLQKISKIFPHKVRSTGNDSNSNIRSIISVALQIAYSSYDEQLENMFEQKIQNEVENQNYFIELKNHTHEGITYGNIIKVIAGFLKTIKNKKIKNPQEFDLTQQVENLPIIIQYLVIVSRTILYRLNIQNSNDLSKRVSDKECFDVLTDYFDLNYLRKDSYYFFEEYSYFIYKDQQEYIFGRYGQSQNSRNKSKSFQDKKNQTLPYTNKYDKDYNLKILQCSMQSGSNLLSSRHADQSTPCFNNIAQGQNFFFKANLRKQVSAQQTKFNQNFDSKNNNDKAFDSKGIQSKSSGFEVNVISQANFKSFNNKYKNNQQLNKQVVNKPLIKISQNNSPTKKYFQQSTNKPNANNETNSQYGSDYFKKNRNQKDILPSKQNFSQLKRARSDQCAQQILKFNAQNAVINRECQNHKNSQNQKFDKIFQWQDDQRRLRRVQTICYRTCTTCHRRFYKNQIKSNIINIQIHFKKQQPRQQNQAIKKNQLQKKNQHKTKNQQHFQKTPKRKENQSPKQNINTNSIKLQSKSHQQFLNKKFHKKSADTVLEVQKLKTQGHVQSRKGVTKEFINVNNNNFTWKNFKTNFNENKSRSITTPQISPAISPKNKQYNQNLYFGNSSKNDFNSIKNVLGARNSVKNQQVVMKNQKQLLKINLEQNNKNISQKAEVSPKTKTFLSFKSEKEFKRMKPSLNGDIRNNINKDKSFNMDKNIISNIGYKIQNFNLQGSLSGYDGQAKRIEANKSPISIQLSKSAQKKIPHFIRKESLKNAIKDLIN